MNSSTVRTVEFTMKNILILLSIFMVVGAHLYHDDMKIGVQSTMADHLVESQHHVDALCASCNKRGFICSQRSRLQVKLTSTPSPYWKQACSCYSKIMYGHILLLISLSRLIFKPLIGRPCSGGSVLPSLY